MLLDVERAQLVLVDYQAKLMPAIFEAQQVLQRAAVLGQLATLFDVPCWGTEQNPAKLGANDARVRAACRETFAKMYFGACAEPDLVQALRPPVKPVGSNARSLPRHLQKSREQTQQPSRDQILVAGCEAHVCLLQTALGLLEEEFEVWVVTDACSSRTERDRDAAFDRLAGAGVELVTTEMVAFEWCQTAEDPRFKQVLALIK